MKSVLKPLGGLPIMMWLDDTVLEEQTLIQALNLSSLPFAFKRICLMPDAHPGYGMPIGGVMATEHVIIPYAVGYDIGCGMHAIKTSLESLTRTDLKKIMGYIRETVPVGKGVWHKTPTSRHRMPSKALLEKVRMSGPQVNPICISQYEKAQYQLGTLGAGNHFIEIQKGDDGFIWFMIHSGSRNLGHKVCTYYNGIAKDLNEKYHSKVDLKKQLAFLPMGSPEGAGYMAEMKYCVEFAKNSRAVMGECVLEAFNKVICNVIPMDIYDAAHNYAAYENHYNKNVIIHRKGATRARLDEIGIIPGSQGTNSYIVRGLGNKQSFESCSHGAGRVGSRTQAKNTLDLKAEIEKLNKQNIVHSVRNKSDLDEAPEAYKDIEEVMENQKDLVKIEVKLKPLGVIKG